MSDGSGGIFTRSFGGLSRTTFLLALSSLFSDVSTEMLYPVLPIFLTQTLHATGSIVGLVDGFAQALQNVVQGFSGTLSDKLQRRKPIALFGYFLAAVAKPLMGLASVWQVVFAARLLDRIGAGSRSAPRDALIAASVDERYRGRAFGLEGLGDNAGAFLGPLVALLLLYGFHVGIRWVFYLAVIPGLIAFCLVLFVHEARAAAAEKAEQEIRLAHFPQAYWKFLAVIALFGLGNSSNAFLILRTQDIDSSLQQTILIYAGFNLVAALISYPAGWLFDHMGGRNVLLGAYVIFFIAYLGFGLTQNIALIATLFVFYGLYQGIFRTAGKGLAASFVPERLRASGIGWFNTTVGILQLIASLVAGALWDRVGHMAVFFYGAIFAAVGIAALLVLIPSRPPAHPE
jgi:MFS family permease